MSGAPTSMRAALEQAMAQRQGGQMGGQPMMGGSDESVSPAMEVVHHIDAAIALFGAMKQLAASSPQVAQMLMAALQGAEGGGQPQAQSMPMG